MAIKGRTWIWIIVGVLAFLLAICFAALGAGVYYVARQVDIQPATGESAQRQFDRTLSRFEGQHPLIVVEGDDWNLQPGPEGGNTGSRSIDSLQVLVWDPDDDKLARVRVPFWLLRLAGPGRIKLSPRDSTALNRLNITVEDIEQHGPGLILDHSDHDGSRVLVWAE